LPNNPNAASSMLSDMVSAMVAANKINEPSNEVDSKKPKK